MNKEREAEIRKEALIRIRDAINADIWETWNKPNKSQYTIEEIDIILGVMREAGQNFHNQANERNKENESI